MNDKILDILNNLLKAMNIFTPNQEMREVKAARKELKNRLLAEEVENKILRKNIAQIRLEKKLSRKANK